MEKVTPVRVTTDKVNCYATVERSCISAITACLRLGDEDHANKFVQLKQWAAGNYQDQVHERFEEMASEQE